MDDIANIIISIVGVILSFFLAKYYGDVAGTKAAIEFEKEKASKAYVVALKALLNEVTRIRSAANHNASLKKGNLAKFTEENVLRIPVGTFETAFLSSNSVLISEKDIDSSRVLDSVVTYLTKADSINSLVDIYFGLTGVSRDNGATNSWRHRVIENIKAASVELSQTLDELENALRKELEVASVETLQ